MDVKTRLQQINTIIVYHCDPSLTTGKGLMPKLSQYDYISELGQYPGCLTGDGRSCDALYGNGGQAEMTVCDVNITCGPGNAYDHESIFIHEYGHSIMSFLPVADVTQIKNAFTDLVQQFDCGTVYGCTNKEEMWAEATQTWFSASLRHSVNKHIDSVAAIETNTPILYAVLMKTYGPPTSLGLC